MRERNETRFTSAFEWELFPNGEHLRPMVRGLYMLCAVVGTLAVVLVLFCVLLEILTTPGVSAWAIRLGVPAALLSAAHVLLEARSARPISWTRWLVFVGVQAVFAFELWTTIRDHTARVVFLVMLVAGGAVLFAARWLVTRGTRTQTPSATAAGDSDGGV